jgi:hypothetical protein
MYYFLTRSNTLPGKIMNKKYIWGPQDNYLNGFHCFTVHISLTRAQEQLCK